MPEVENLIRNYCDEKMSNQTAGIRHVERMMPKFLYAVTPAGAMRREIEDHLKDSYGRHLREVADTEGAWRQTREQFGDMTGIARQMRAAQMQFYRHFLLRLTAIIAVFVIFASHIFLFPWFISMPALAFPAGGAALGWLIKRELNPHLLREFAFGGAWFGLFVGLALALSVDEAANAGYPITLILMSAFYGLVLAVPGKKGLAPILMMVLCNVGILVPLARLNIFPLYSQASYPALLRVSAVAFIVALIGGLAIFGSARISRRLVGVSMLAMMLCYCRMLSSIDRFSLIDLVATAALSVLMTIFFLLRVRAFQAMPDALKN